MVSIKGTQVLISVGNHFPQHAQKNNSPGCAGKERDGDLGSGLQLIKRERWLFLVFLNQLILQSQV